MSDFARLLEAEIPRLRRYARALTRDMTRADDLVQSCLTRAVAKQHLWEAGTDLRAWLFTILHNQHVNDVRRSARESSSVAIDEARALAVPSNAIATLELRDLEAALGKLAHEQRRALRAHVCARGGREQLRRLLGREPALDRPEDGRSSPRRRSDDARRAA